MSLKAALQQLIFHAKGVVVLDVFLILLNPVHLTVTLSYNPYVAVLTLDGHVDSLVEWGASLVKKSFQTGVDTSVVLCSAVLDRKPR